MHSLAHKILTKSNNLQLTYRDLTMFYTVRKLGLDVWFQSKCRHSYSQRLRNYCIYFFHLIRLYGPKKSRKDDILEQTGAQLLLRWLLNYVARVE